MNKFCVCEKKNWNFEMAKAAGVGHFDDGLVAEFRFTARSSDHFHSKVFRCPLSFQCVLEFGNKMETRFFTLNKGWWPIMRQPQSTISPHRVKRTMPVRPKQPSKSPVPAICNQTTLRTVWIYRKNYYTQKQTHTHT